MQNNERKLIKPLEGLTIIENFITPEEEKKMVEEIKKNKWNTSLKRLTQHYGYTYNYKSRSITSKDYVGKLPKWLDNTIDSIVTTTHVKEKPDQAIVNRYLPGEGISAHIDSLVFKEQIYSLSLNSGCTITFARRVDDKVERESVYLKPRSLFIMEGDARYKYAHAINPVSSDTVNGKKIDRGIRYSVTFRNVILS